jgi:ribosomal protein S27E
MSPRLLSLDCPNCGANLQFKTGITQFACSYCGASVAVHNEGGTVSLSKIAASVGRLGSHAEKLAAELALARYEKEIGELEARFEAVEHPHHTRTGLGCASALVLGVIAATIAAHQPAAAAALACVAVAVAVFVYKNANPPEHAAIQKQLIGLRSKAAEQRRIVDGRASSSV